MSYGTSIVTYMNNAKKNHRALSQAVSTDEMTDKLVGIRVLEYEYEITAIPEKL